MAKVVVVGAGPAGLAAAVSAAEAGATVTLVDDNALPGGQIWRASHVKSPHPSVQRSIRRLDELGVCLRFGRTVVDVRDGHLFLNTNAGCESLAFDSLVLCTGARELFLPFPGWTLPGVMGAGGAQALLKGGANFEDRRVVVSGSGPLLLAVGASFVKAGAEVVGIYEQAPLTRLARFGMNALHPKRMVEALGYIASVGITPYSAGMWVTAAIGRSRVEAVQLTNGTQTWTEECDLFACAYGLVPNIELAELLGCETSNGCVVVDGDFETTRQGVFAAGEPLGIGGLDLAIAEGSAAGAAAAGSENIAAKATARKLQPFRKLLAESFKLRPELVQLANKETILCRCEDVQLGAIDPAWSARQAKLYTRIGMGPCQGRVCGPAARCLFGWESDRARPPLYPTEVNHLAAQEVAEIL